MNVTRTFTLPLEDLNDLDALSKRLDKKLPETMTAVVKAGIREIKRKNGLDQVPSSG